MEQKLLQRPLALTLFDYHMMLDYVAPWIDFDDYKAFEGVTNDFSLEKDLLYF